MQEKPIYKKQEHCFTESQLIMALWDQIALKNHKARITEPLPQDHLTVSLVKDAFKQLQTKPEDHNENDKTAP